MSHYRIRYRRPAALAMLAFATVFSSSASFATEAGRGLVIDAETPSQEIARDAQPDAAPGGGSAGTASATGLEAYLAALEGRATARTFLMMFRDLLFVSGSSLLDDLAQRELARMADFLRTHPESVARIIGYTDDRGEPAANQLLAGRRANAVRDYLIVLGVDGARLTATSEDELAPADDNRTTTGRDHNRRVQIFVHQVQDDAAR